VTAIDHDELLSLLNVTVHRAGSTKAFSATAKVSSGYLEDILAQRVRIPDFLAKRIGYRARVIYEPIEPAEEDRLE
jgi:hypothetical protein